MLPLWMASVVVALLVTVAIIDARIAQQEDRAFRAVLDELRRRYGVVEDDDV